MTEQSGPPVAAHAVPTLVPADEHNRALPQTVHPPDWRNRDPAPRYTLVVIGAGTAGLVTAAGAAGLGARVALIERYLLGGDCLNVGCVPSKCVIRSSRVVGDVHDAAGLGVPLRDGADPDFGAVMERMRRLRARISHHDSAERFQHELGVDVFLGDARFAGPDTVAVDGQALRFKRAVIATGARASHPPIPGLAEAGFLTNESVFSLTERPAALAVIGAGPIGCELAQAFRRLGSEVVLFDAAPHVLVREDADAAEILQRAFEREGIRLVLSCELRRVTRRGQRRVIEFAAGEVAVDEILVGAGRAPNVEGLGLEAVGVQYDPARGVAVNDRLQTTNPRLYAPGDVCMQHKVTHLADAAARLGIPNTLFLGPKKPSARHARQRDPSLSDAGRGDPQDGRRLQPHPSHAARQAGVPVVARLDAMTPPRLCSPHGAHQRPPGERDPYRARVRSCPLPLRRSRRGRRGDLRGAGGRRSPRRLHARVA